MTDEMNIKIKICEICPIDKDYKHYCEKGQVWDSLLKLSKKFPDSVFKVKFKMINKNDLAEIPLA